MITQNDVNFDYRDRAKAILEELLFLYPKESTYQIVGISPRKRNALVCKDNLVIGKEGVVSGYFKEHKAALKHGLELDENMLPDGVYVSLNPCNDDLLEKTDHCLQANVERVKDNDIPQICNLLVDVNPIRPDGVSSTDEELEHAMQMALKVKRDSIENGWSEPLVGNAGNSAQLIYKVDLPNTQESHELIHGVLQVLHDNYRDEKIEIDTTVSNAGALVRMYGTLVRKGDNLPERPHRVSKIISVPETPEIVPVDLLRSFSGDSDPKTDKDDTKIRGAIISGEDLLNMKFEDNPVIIDNLIEEKQATLLLGPSDAGKSISVLNIALSLGSSMVDDIWGLKINRHVPTLFVQSESTSKDIKDRIILMVQGNLCLRQGVKNIHFASIHPNDIRVTGHSFADHRFVDFMIDNILKTGAKLVVYDPLASFHHDNSRRGLDNVKAICDRTNSACIVVHHGDISHFQNSGITNPIQYWADNVFWMEQSSNPDGAIRIKCKKARHFSKPEAFHTKVNEHLIFEKIEANVSKSPLESSIVLHALKRLGGAVTKQADLSNEIISNTGKSISTVRNIITDAVKAGLISELSNPNNKRDKGYRVAHQPTIP